jgi:SAM-dependent methyltransferase
MTPNCLLCGGPTRRRLSARDYRRLADRTAYVLNWCDKCQFGRLAGDFAPERVAAFYDIPYYTHGVPEAAHIELSLMERIRCHLAWRRDYGIDFHPVQLGQPNNRLICDIGCGAGNKIEAMKLAGFRVIGVEPDPKARQMATKIAEVFDGAAENLPPQLHGRLFDIVLMLHVLEHCVDPHLALDNAGSLLNADGTLIIEVPNNAALGFLSFGACWPWCDIPRHINFFTEKSLCALLQEHGFSTVDIRYTGYYRQFTTDWIGIQRTIWDALRTGEQPNFDLSAWRLLFRTAFTAPSRKYDSVRISAARRA